MSRVGRRITVLVLSGTLAAGGGVVGSLAAGGTPAGAASLPSSVRFSFKGSFPLPGHKSVPVTVTGRGACNFVAETASASVRVPAKVTKSLPGGAAKPATLKMRLVHGTLYLSYPGLASLTGGKSWISDALGTQKSWASVFQLVDSILGDLGPSLKDAAPGEVHKLGTKVIDGVKARGYMLKLPSTSGAEKIWYWLDSSGQLVLSKVHLNPPKGAKTAAATRFFGYGAVVSVAAPRPSAVKAEPTSVLQGYVALFDQLVDLLI
jgi:hypothetical protein